MNKRRKNGPKITPAAIEKARRYRNYLDLWTGEPLTGLDAEERASEGFGVKMSHYAVAANAGCPYRVANEARAVVRGVSFYAFSEMPDGSGRVILVGFDRENREYLVKEVQA